MNFGELGENQTSNFSTTMYATAVCLYAFNKDYDDRSPTFGRHPNDVSSSKNFTIPPRDEKAFLCF